MTIPRAVTKLGLLLTTLAALAVANYPRIALALANIGDRLSALGLHLACR
jgi:hypothetical protein